MFLDAEESDEWHTAFGGGIFFAVLSRSTVFSLSVARSDEHMSVLLGSGFWFWVGPGAGSGPGSQPRSDRGVGAAHKGRRAWPMGRILNSPADPPV